ncbi:MAG TPA: hypothetical protein VFE82_16365 [Ramlibacter sp.]|jgi:hypothetical protein|uniref:hypothetical protein n=1 Tax=Ramlibacter sp. TaxID=1917967 RepID=UPI002D6902CE|nr:hypothetical protein [Ramlibacter sp.]HZY20047.1 hypothetical protein [Ramlibacter sp.]
MNASILSRALPAAAVLAFAAALPVQAQTTATDPNTGGRPAQTSQDPNAGTRAPTPGVIQKAENSRPAKATKRVAKKGTNAVKRAGSATAGAVRGTGEAVSKRLPQRGAGTTGTGGEASSPSAPTATPQR